MRWWDRIQGSMERPSERVQVAYSDIGTVG